MKKTAVKCIFNLLLLILIAVFGFYVNRDIEIRGLYMDDLYMWSCYGEQSLLEFVFPIGTSTRFRPVYWLATYLQMAIIGTHVDRFAAFNIIINIFVAYELFFMAQRLVSGFKNGLSAPGYKCGGCIMAWIPGSIAAFFVSLCYLASRFAYYQIGQALGLMETMALAMSIGILWILLEFVSVPYCGLKRFYVALMLWFLLVFVHERYLCLFPLFYIALAMRLYLRYGSGSGRFKGTGPAFGASWITPAAMLLIIIAIRTFATGSAMPAGTGGTYVTDTFSISEAFGYCIDQVLYIFGVNAGPEYLCGIEWGQTPPYIKRLVKFSVLFIGAVCIIFTFAFIKNLAAALGRHDAIAAGKTSSDLFSSILFACFMALCIGCSSVTIRLEMRWIYVSYTAALLWAACMLGSLGGIPAAAAFAAFILYALLSVYTNIFCRGYFINLYFWPDQLRMNSLAEETVEKYGIEYIKGKNIYILENSYGMSDFYAETFYKPYDPDKKAEGTVIIFAEDIGSVPLEEVASGSALVIEEVPGSNAYRDITESLAAGQQPAGF